MHSLGWGWVPRLARGVGAVVGADVGLGVGAEVGEGVGAVVGADVGLGVGAEVGEGVGAPVGARSLGLVWGPRLARESELW